MWRLTSGTAHFTKDFHPSAQTLPHPRQTDGLQRTAGSAIVWRETPDETAMSVFKFACPVCGQHIECTADKAGSPMECPTCFRKLVVPHPSAEGSSSLVLTASEVQTRSIPLPGGTAPAPASATKKSPLVAIALGLLVLGVAAGAIVFRKTLFGGRNQTGRATRGADTNRVGQLPAPPPAPPSGDDAFWLTNLTGVTIPDAPAAGRVSGKSFTIERATIKGGHLDLRQGPNWPPDVGLSVQLFAKQPEDLAGKTVSIEPDREKFPRVILRTRNEEGKAVNENCFNGYSLRVEFGAVASGRLPGKIYFCGPDPEKSYVMGTFDAEIRRPTPPKPKP